MGESHANGEGMAVSPPRLTRSEVVLLLVLGAVQFTNIMDFMIVLPLGPQYMRELSISPQQFGFMVSAYGFSAGLCGLLAALFIDRFDRKNALLALYAGFAVSTLLCAVAPGYLFLVLARTVAGGCGGVMGATILAIIGDAFPDAKRGTAMGVVMSAFSLASIAGVPAGLFLSFHFGWRAPFGVLGLLSLPILVLAWRVLPPIRGHLARAAGGAANFWSVLTHPTHVRAYVLMLALVLSTFMIIPYLAAYMVANVGRPEGELPYIYLCGGIATLLTLTPVGRLADRFGKLPVFRTLALFALVPTFLVTNLPPVSLGLMLAASTLFMVVTSGRMVPAMALITASAAPGLRGSFMSVNAAVQHLASGLASLVGGTLLGKTAGGALTGFPLVGCLAAGAMTLSVVLAGRLQPAKRDGAEFDPEITPEISLAGEQA